MTEIFIQKNGEQRKIALVENGKLIEYYEEESSTNRKEGNIYIGVVKDIVKGMQSAFVDIGADKNSLIHVKDAIPKKDETKEKYDENIEIAQVLKPQQRILVQVKKDSNEKKGARVSTHINLPSKYIALMPNTEIVTISQKISDKKEQERLIKLVKENLKKGNGAIIRTSAEGKEQEIIDDIKNIEAKWEEISKLAVETKGKNAQLLYTSEDIVEKMLMDLPSNTIEKITVNSKEEQQWLEKIKKENKEYQNIKIVLQASEDILKAYGLQEQINKNENRKIWLKCGGFITIEKTEALTAIDVNTGKYTGNKNLEQTVFKVNKEATVEIAKQLKVRDIGGIIIIDYIDMKKNENKELIKNLLKEELKKDRAKTQVEGFTKLDLMELTRKHICSHKE